MASNTRYPPWESHEEVLDTPGLPEQKGVESSKSKYTNALLTFQD